jgi:hypothetical protein
MTARAAWLFEFSCSLRGTPVHRFPFAFEQARLQTSLPDQNAAGDNDLIRIRRLAAPSASKHGSESRCQTHVRSRRKKALS